MCIPDIKIRTANSNEVPIALELLKQAAEWLQRKNISYWQNWLKPQKAYVNWIQEGFNNNEFYFAYYNSNLAGMFRLQWTNEIYWNEHETKAGYVHAFTTSRKYYGKGVGIEILQQMEHICIKNGKTHLRLACGCHLTKLIKYYEYLGFRKVGKSITMGEDLLLFEKQLDSQNKQLDTKL